MIAYRHYTVEDDHLPEDLLETSPELVRRHLKINFNVIIPLSGSTLF